MHPNFSQVFFSLISNAGLRWESLGSANEGWSAYWNRGLQIVYEAHPRLFNSAQLLRLLGAAEEKRGEVRELGAEALTVLLVIELRL